MSPDPESHEYDPRLFYEDETRKSAKTIALAEPAEPVAHKHEWFCTGAMEPEEMRCIHCGMWNRESEPTPRKPLTDEEILKISDLYGVEGFDPDLIEFTRAIERAHGIKGW